MADLNISVLSIYYRILTLREACIWTHEFRGPAWLLCCAFPWSEEPQGQENMPIRAYTHILTHNSGPQISYSNIPEPI